MHIYTCLLYTSRTQNLLWRVRYDNYNSWHPENIVIAIGITNLISGKDSPENTAEGIIAVANEVRKQFPESRIILLGLFPSGKEQQSKVVPYRRKYGRR